MILQEKTQPQAVRGSTMLAMRTLASALVTGVFTLFVPTVVAVGLPQALVREGHVALTGGIASRVLGVALVALGDFGYFWCATLFVRARGTPAPVFPTQETVVRGLYRFNRNPMYTSVLAIIFGQAVLYPYRMLVAYGVAVAVFFHLFVLVYEEPALRARFDGEYDEFCRRVPRWIPRLR